MPKSQRDLEDEIDELAGTYYDDPLGFALDCFSWPIHGEMQPDVWQQGILREVGAAVRERAFDGVNAVLPIRTAVSSGHGIGKSVTIAMLVIWLMSTRKNCRGTITANTNDQLASKTWATIRTWLNYCVTGSLYEMNSQIMFRKRARASWFCTPQSCAEENSEAFAGQHAKDSSSFYMFDEASAIPPKIWEVAEGGLTDGEPFLFAFGNPTRNTGKFYEAVFGAKSHRWNAHIIDSRTCKFSNKVLIQEWLDDLGGDEDDDFFKVRVRGLPPSASEAQFIDAERIKAAKARQVDTLADEPLIAGVDVSGGGNAWTVCRLRRGLDARFPAIRISGEKSRDRNHLVSVLAERLAQGDIAAMFIDMAFGAAIVERLRMLGYPQVFEVNFGGESVDATCANQRSLMWKRLKEWLAKGGIDAKDERLAMDFAKPGYHLNQKNKLVLESKESMQKRGEASPDDGDALALTFAQPVSPAGMKPKPFPVGAAGPSGGASWLA